MGNSRQSTDQARAGCTVGLGSYFCSLNSVSSLLRQLPACELGVLTRVPARGWFSRYLDRAGRGPGPGSPWGSRSGVHLGCSHKSGCSDTRPSAPDTRPRLERQEQGWVGLGGRAAEPRAPPPGHITPLSIWASSLSPSSTSVPVGGMPAFATTTFNYTNFGG